VTERMNSGNLGLATATQVAPARTVPGSQTTMPGPLNCAQTCAVVATVLPFASRPTAATQFCVSDAFPASGNCTTTLINDWPPAAARSVPESWHGTFTPAIAGKAVHAQFSAEVIDMI